MGAGIIRVLILFISMGYAQDSQEVQWSFKSYLQEFLKQDEKFFEAQYNKEVTTGNAQSDFDVFQNTLELQPTYTNTELSTPNGNFFQERSNIEGKITQLLPTGSTLSLSGNKFYDDPNNALGGLDLEYNVFFEQALWQNAFGYGTRSLKKSARARIEEATYAENQALLDSCLNAAEVYLAAYLGQEKKLLSEELLNDSQKALSIARRGYDRRILRKIDFLNARSDFLQVKATNLNAKMNYEQTLSTLLTRVAKFNVKTLPSLSEPNTFFAQMQVPTVFDKEKIESLKRSLASIEADKHSYYAVKSQNRSKVNFGFNGGHSQRLSATGVSAGAFNQNDTDYVQVYLKLELPIVNRTQDGAIDASFYQWQISQVQNQRLEKDLRNQFKQLHVEIEKLESELKISQENQNIKKQQLKEAERLLKVGKINFDDYTNYRDSFFSEKENELDIKSSLWQNKTKLSQFGDNLGPYCRGIM